MAEDPSMLAPLSESEVSEEAILRADTLISDIKRRNALDKNAVITGNTVIKPADRELAKNELVRLSKIYIPVVRGPANTRDVLDDLFELAGVEKVQAILEDLRENTEALTGNKAMGKKLDDEFSGGRRTRKSRKTRKSRVRRRRTVRR